MLALAAGFAAVSIAGAVLWARIERRRDADRDRMLAELVNRSRRRLRA